MRCLNEKFNLSVMVIDLFNLEKSPFEFESEIAAAEIDLKGENFRLKDAVKVKGTLSQHIAQIDVEGEIAAVIEVECVRCLQPIDDFLQAEFKVAYVTPENYTQAKEAELGANDLDAAIFAGDKIDLIELAREQILLNAPEKIFCREDCRGLCEKCGANRNLINCNCEEKEIDPRWSALKNLK